MLPTISAVIITYNEEKNIKDCILSVHDWCDEVIVLDSYSTDKTELIAKRFPKVKFKKHKFDGHIAQKNRANRLAKSKWLICLDADERVTSKLSLSIQSFIQNSAHKKGARVKRLTRHMDKDIKHGGWYNARYRLIKKGEGEWKGENPHDYILLNGISRPTIGTVLKGDLIHYSFQDLSHQVDTINKFSSIVAFTRFNKGRRYHLWQILIKPVSKFIEIYFAKRGFLDGVPGFVIAISSSYSTFLKFAKLYELQVTKLKRPSNLAKDYK